MSAAAKDWSVFDREDLRGAITSADSGAGEVLVAIDGMHCANCVARVERVLTGTAEDVRINLAAKTAAFRWNPRQTRLSAILAALDTAGYTPQVLAHEDSFAAAARERRNMLTRIGVATICAMQVMMLAWPSYFGVQPPPGIAELLRWAQLILAVPCVLWSGWPFFANARNALRAKALNMDVPVALALAVAFLTSLVRVVGGAGDLYFDTATMFVCFLLIGRFLESRTRAIAGERLRLLAGRRALTAQRRVGDALETVPIGQLRGGDVVIVAPGEALPVDGELLDGAAELDESLLTGESQPVLHRLGDSVLAGSLHLGAAPLSLRAVRVGAQTVLAQITQLLDRAQTQKPKLQLFADRIAGHFVLAILILAGIGALLAWRHGADHAISVALAVMVASCPCALSLAVPAALAAATSRLAGGGVLVANARALTALPEVDVVLFDKTGTLTQPQLSLRHVEVIRATQSREDCTALAVALEQGSLHPIARAFADLKTPYRATELLHEPGRGVEGRIDGRRYRLGALAVVPPVLQAQLPGATWISLGDDEGLLAHFALNAEPRPEAAGLLSELRRRGLHIELLTGDAEGATTPLAARLGIDAVATRQTPQDKLARLHALRAQGHRVLAVGDGLNDAPFLAAADVSAALPHGAALTQSRADLLLLGDSLSGLPQALDLARQATRRMHENFIWALIYNVFVLPLAMFGYLAPWIAAAGMSLSSLLVVLNALRLRTPRRAPPAGPAPPISALPPLGAH